MAPFSCSSLIVCMLLLSFSVLSLEPLLRFSHLYLKPLVLNLSRLTTLYCILLLYVLGIISLLITSLLVSTIYFLLIIIDRLRMTPRHLTTDPESLPCFEAVFCFSPYVQFYQVLSVWEKALEQWFLTCAGVLREGRQRTVLKKLAKTITYHMFTLLLQQQDHSYEVTTK